jgi:hypothetical protein
MSRSKISSLPWRLHGGSPTSLLYGRMINECWTERLWKEMYFRAQFKLLPLNFVWRDWGRTQTPPSQDSWSPGRDSKIARRNGVPTRHFTPEYRLINADINYIDRCSSSKTNIPFSAFFGKRYSISALFFFLFAACYLYLGKWESCYCFLVMYQHTICKCMTEQMNFAFVRIYIKMAFESFRLSRLLSGFLSRFDLAHVS